MKNSHWVIYHIFSGLTVTGKTHFPAILGRLKSELGYSQRASHPTLPLLSWEPNTGQQPQEPGSHHHIKHRLGTVRLVYPEDDSGWRFGRPKPCYCCRCWAWDKSKLDSAMLLDMGTNTQSFHAPVTTVSLIWDVKEHKATLMGKKGVILRPDRW